MFVFLFLVMCFIYVLRDFIFGGYDTLVSWQVMIETISFSHGSRLHYFYHAHNNYYGEKGEFSIFVSLDLLGCVFLL